MARVKFDVGATADILSPGEHQAVMAGVVDRLERRRVQGRRMMKFQLSGVVASSAILLGQAELVGPEAGFLWSVGRLVAWGLTSGATPDELNVYINNQTGAPEWQLNGNNWAYTFSKGEFTLHGGDTLLFANNGTLAATGQIIVKGEARQVPEEAQGELM